MSQRHPFQNEATMFVTTNTLNRMPLFSKNGFAKEAIDCLYRTQEQHPFFLFGFVIMPDHCHLLLQVRSPYTISKLMNAYKSGLTFDLGIPKLWQPRFDLRIPEKPYETLKYIHMNPVKAGFCEKPEEYPWSSACGKWEVTPLDAW